jgi:hypothetical protein
MVVMTAMIVGNWVGLWDRYGIWNRLDVAWTRGRKTMVLGVMVMVGT